jgi:hypothetical protein
VPAVWFDAVRSDDVWPAGVAAAEGSGLAVCDSPVRSQLRLLNSMIAAKAEGPADRSKRDFEFFLVMIGDAPPLKNPLLSAAAPDFGGPYVKREVKVPLREV